MTGSTREHHSTTRPRVLSVRVWPIDLQAEKIRIKLMPHQETKGGGRHEHIVPGYNREGISWMVDRS